MAFYGMMWLFRFFISGGFLGMLWLFFGLFKGLFFFSGVLAC